MAWSTEMVTILRFLINDTAATPEFSDSRLQQTLLVAAQLVQTDLQFNTAYSVNVSLTTLSPDPTDSGTRDDIFINLVELKAACIIDRGKLRTNADSAFKITSDNDTIDTSGVSKAYADLIKLGYCQAYQDAKEAYKFENRIAGEAILTPFKTLYANLYCQPRTF